MGCWASAPTATSWGRRKERFDGDSGAVVTCPSGLPAYRRGLSRLDSPGRAPSVCTASACTASPADAMSAFILNPVHQSGHLVGDLTGQPADLRRLEQIDLTPLQRRQRVRQPPHQRARGLHQQISVITGDREGQSHLLGHRSSRTTHRGELGYRTHLPPLRTAKRHLLVVRSIEKTSGFRVISKRLGHNQDHTRTRVRSPPNRHWLRKQNSKSRVWARDLVPPHPRRLRSSTATTVHRDHTNGPLATG